MEFVSVVRASVDAVGKLGPLAVAIAVYLENRRQARWTKAVSRHAAEVEDQKLRLALLERRAIAIDAVAEAGNEFGMYGRVSTEMVTKVYDALRVAELVFDDDEEAAIRTLLDKLIAWQMANGRQKRWYKSDETKFLAALDEAFDLETVIIEHLNRLPSMLRKASKVSQAPLAETQPAPRFSWFVRKSI
jgi:hypothetical protein